METSQAVNIFARHGALPMDPTKRPNREEMRKRVIEDIPKEVQHAEENIAKSNAALENMVQLLDRKKQQIEQIKKDLEQDNKLIEDAKLKLLDTKTLNDKAIKRLKKERENIVKQWHEMENI